MTADELFQAALKRRGFVFSITEAGLYQVQLGDGSATISLENIRRNFARDQDATAVEHFARHFDEQLLVTETAWDQAAPYVRFSLEPSDYATGFDNTLHNRVTDSLVQIYVVTTPDGSRITWISHDMMARWGVRQEDVRAAAETNMAQVVKQTKLEVQAAGDVDLGMLSMEDTPFKASLILSAEFPKLVSPQFGWPVFVVAPARDFVYVLSQSSANFLPRLGKVVLREYKQSGYPVTAEVLAVGDEGLTAVGAYANKDA